MKNQRSRIPPRRKVARRNKDLIDKFRRPTWAIINIYSRIDSCYCTKGPPGRPATFLYGHVQRRFQDGGTGIAYITDGFFDQVTGTHYKGGIDRIFKLGTEDNGDKLDQVADLFWPCQTTVVIKSTSLKLIFAEDGRVRAEAGTSSRGHMVIGDISQSV